MRTCFFKDRRTEEHGFLERQKNMRTWFFKDRRTEEHGFFKRQENRRTCFGGKDWRTYNSPPYGGGVGGGAFISQSIQWHMPIFPPYVQ